jgi:hypothetical protein
MSSSFPPPSQLPPSEPPTIASVLDELGRLRARVASEDRTAILDAIKRIDRDLRTIDRSSRSL